MLALRATAELGSWDQVHAKLQQPLGPGERIGALTVAAVLGGVNVCRSPVKLGSGSSGVTAVTLARIVGSSSSKGPRTTDVAPVYFSSIILFQKSSNIFVIVFQSILRKTTILLILVLQYEY